MRTTSNLGLSAAICAWRVLIAAGADADARSTRGCETPSAKRSEILSATSEIVAGIVHTRHQAATWLMWLPSKYVSTFDQNHSAISLQMRMSLFLLLRLVTISGGLPRSHPIANSPCRYARLITGHFGCWPLAAVGSRAWHPPHRPPCFPHHMLATPTLFTRRNWLSGHFIRRAATRTRRSFRTSSLRSSSSHRRSKIFTYPLRSAASRCRAWPACSSISRLCALSGLHALKWRPGMSGNPLQLYAAQTSCRELRWRAGRTPPRRDAAILGRELTNYRL